MGKLVSTLPRRWGMRLWNRDEERLFFIKALEIASHDKLFYRVDDGKTVRYLAYWPKEYKGSKTTLQSRNAIIGSYTEKWLAGILKEIVPRKYYVVQSMVCPEIGLTNNTPADIAICKKSATRQNPEDVLLIAEVKMSVVWNWEYLPDKNELLCVGDFTTHTGVPSLLRSDSMLKAIGKCINIRAASKKASHISLIVVGNTPITKNYYRKVDRLVKTGIIQGFYSVNPEPTDDPNHPLNIKATKGKGFVRLDSAEELKQILVPLLGKESVFFSGMMKKEVLGRIIEEASRGKTYEEKAEKFIQLLEAKA